MAPPLGFGGSEYRIQWLSIAGIIIVALCIDICKSVKNTKFADLQNIEVEQRIIWYIIFHIKKISPEKILLLPFKKIEEQYPELDFRIFELVQLNEFVNHQIAHNVIFVSVESGLGAYVFDSLKERYTGKILLNPSVETFHQ